MSKNPETQHQILNKYCQNITEQAKLGKLDPVIGRHEEIRRVLQICSRRTKNNPVLIGDPGVGKTAIVEGIAQRIINKDVPETLKNKVLYSLDLGLLVAGAKYQGEFEERLKSILTAINELNDSIILFIDELHMLVGAGGSGGGMDASNLLKPALARGELHCIGATTVKEYKKYIEKDAALERRFQKVFIAEPNIEDAISILRGLKEKYELHHGIKIKDSALIQAVQLSAKNIPERFLPDKAIDLVDEAASMVKMALDSKPEELDKIERKIRQLEIEKVALNKEKDVVESKTRLEILSAELDKFKEQQKVLLNKWESERAPLEEIMKLKEEIETTNYKYEQAERVGDFAKASELKYGKLNDLKLKLKAAQEKLEKNSSKMLKEEVTDADIATVLSRWTQIPVEKLQQAESDKLLAMESILKQRVIGQDEALEKISHAIQIQRAGLKDQNKPIGVFLFLGPTGVGKTEVAKTLADFLFNDEKKIVRIDMSEYSEQHAVARLIGAPPGYIGYEEGGQLTEAVRKNPYSIVLFDEIEKANPAIFNIFLQLLDEGRLTDAQGRTINFKHCVIIMTSNIGSELILNAKVFDAVVKKQINALLHKNFKPEFLNRIDEIIFFKILDKKAIKDIVGIQLERLKKQLLENGVHCKFEENLIDFIAEVGAEPEFGARPLKRAIYKLIIVPLSNFLLKNPNKKNLRLYLENKLICIK